MQIFRALATGEYTIEEIDAITGPAIGRPKSATFRTMDIAGIDVLAHVARNLAERLESPDDRRSSSCLRWCRAGAARLGRRESRTGFLQEGRRWRDSDARPGVDGVPSEAARATSLSRCRSKHRQTWASESPRSSKATTRSDDFCALRSYRRSTMHERVAPHIAHDRADVDKAMRWGFGWELGPFETMPYLRAAAPRAPPAARAKNVVKKNAGASLIDLGDGVLSRRVPFEDERHRRRHDPDASGRGERGGRKFRRHRRRRTMP